MNIINRDTLIAEELIREHVRGRISHNMSQRFKAESIIRKGIRNILTEAETGTDEPSGFTGINVLASLLEKIIPVIEDDYKMLTTSPEQRESFRNHMVHAIKNTLKPIESADEAEEDVKESFEFEIDTSLLEKMKIDMSPEGSDVADDVEGEFIDIAAPEDQFVHIDNQNETGRNFASDTFNKVEKQIVDAYDMLADKKDQDLFYDYLITNMLLYFDKFEDELQETLPDVTTPEYEKAKSDIDNEEDEPASEPLDTSEEEPEEAPDAASEEEPEEDLLGGPSGDS